MQAVPMLPGSKITSVPQYPTSTAAQTGMAEVVTDLRKKAPLCPKHTPHTSPQCGQLNRQTGDGTLLAILALLGLPQSCKHSPALVLGGRTLAGN